MKYKKYTNEEMLVMIKEFYDNNGYIPKEKDFEYNYDVPDTREYIEAFGSWNKAIKEFCLILKSQKMCSKCGEVYPSTLDFFEKAPKNKDGLSYDCKECRIKARKEKYKKDKKLGKITQYYKTNKLKYIATTLRRKDYPNITEFELQEIINNFKDNEGISICPYCGREILEDDMMHFDHFIPYSKKDECSSLVNLIPVCRYCNRSKQDEEFSYWYQNQFFYNVDKEQKIINYIEDGNLIPYYI